MHPIHRPVPRAMTSVCHAESESPAWRFHVPPATVSSWRRKRLGMEERHTSPPPQESPEATPKWCAWDYCMPDARAVAVTDQRAPPLVPVLAHDFAGGRIQHHGLRMRRVIEVEMPQNRARDGIERLIADLRQTPGVFNEPQK